MLTLTEGRIYGYTGIHTKSELNLNSAELSWQQRLFESQHEKSIVAFLEINCDAARDPFLNNLFDLLLRFLDQELNRSSISKIALVSFFCLTRENST